MPPFTLGRVIAFLALVAALVLTLIGRIELLQGVLFMALALALVVP
jgi:hypothetical protein